MRSREGGAEETVRADYLIAADGAHSLVREQSDIAMAGRGAFAECVTIYFRADMRDPDRGPQPQRGLREPPRTAGVLPVLPRRGRRIPRRLLHDRADGTRDTHVAEDLDAARCVDLVRKALGRPDLGRGVDNVQRWSAAASGPARFQDRRVFLAGDAAHVMPPTGGFGGNTGVADAHNLAWKLALVAPARPGPTLLDTYDAERRPVGALTVEQAYTRYVLRVDPSLPRDDLADPLDDASIELGPVYRSAAVLGPDEDDGALLADPRRPGGRPGTRAPHLPVELDGAQASVLDVLGHGFVLLAGPGGQSWCDATAAVSERLGVPLLAYRVAVDGTVVDLRGSFPESFGTGIDGAVLVRPDGVVRLADLRGGAGSERGARARRANVARSARRTGGAAPAAAGRGAATAGATTRPTTTATPNARLSSVTSGLSPSTQWPPGTARRTRLTTSRSGREGNRARTTSPGRTAPAGTHPADQQPVAVSARSGAIDGPVTRASAQRAGQRRDRVAPALSLSITASRVADDPTPRHPEARPCVSPACSPPWRPPLTATSPAASTTRPRPASRPSPSRPSRRSTRATRTRSSAPAPS